MRRALVAVSLLFAACGGGTPDGGPSGGVQSAAVARYLGAWEFVSGRISERCTDGRSAADDMAGSVMGIEAAGGARIIMREAGNCNVSFIVNGDYADVAPDQVCPLSGSSGTDGEYRGGITFTSGSLRASEGGGLQMSHSYELYVKWDSGANLRCYGEKVGTLKPRPY